MKIYKPKICVECYQSFIPTNGAARSCSDICRFMNLIKIQPNGCWHKIKIHKKPNPTFTINGISKNAKRAAWILFRKEPLVDKAPLMQLCPNRDCYNPEHMTCNHLDMDIERLCTKCNIKLTLDNQCLKNKNYIAPLCRYCYNVKYIKLKSTNCLYCSKKLTFKRTGGHNHSPIKYCNDTCNFLSKIHKKKDCWLWKGYMAEIGRPIFNPSKKIYMNARKAAFILLKNKTKKELDRHEIYPCKEELRCVNVDHLTLTHNLKGKRCL